jgi:DEAD/DEAH box helicase domain-containing protein
MKKIIFDIETKNIFSDVASNNAADLDLSVISLHDSETNKYYSFLENQLDDMWHFFKNADMLITFNGNHFDIPLLQKYAPFNLSDTYHLDIFAEVEKSIGKKIGLDAIASITLGTSKSANGLQAVA